MSRGGFDFDNDRYWALSALVHEVKHVSSLYKRVVNHRRRWLEDG